MTICPVCMNEANNEGECCSVCGYRFQDATQQFAAIPVKSEPVKEKDHEDTAATLSVRYGKQEGLVFKLDSDVVQIGRSPKCGVMLNDMTVSRFHAELLNIDGEWVISDHDSFNGVWVNNKAVKRAVLKDGDIIQIGCFVVKFNQ